MDLDWTILDSLTLEKLGCNPQWILWRRLWLWKYGISPPVLQFRLLWRWLWWVVQLFAFLTSEWVLSLATGLTHALTVSSISPTGGYGGGMGRYPYYERMSYAYSAPRALRPDATLPENRMRRYGAPFGGHNSYWGRRPYYSSFGRRNLYMDEDWYGRGRGLYSPGGISKSQQITLSVLRRTSRLTMAFYHKLFDLQ